MYRAERRDVENGFVPAIGSDTYCKSCASTRRVSGDAFDTWEEADAWLYEETRRVRQDPIDVVVRLEDRADEAGYPKAELYREAKLLIEQLREEASKSYQKGYGEGFSAGYVKAMEGGRSPSPLYPVQATPNSCRACGLKLDGPMCYVCPRHDCPTFARIT